MKDFALKVGACLVALLLLMICAKLDQVEPEQVCAAEIKDKYGIIHLVSGRVADVSTD